ncbi:MAG: HYR domain-containing protein [Saprospirales bacterium]|nr:HYR domain-containing protein [Saprospirales bacterium]
MNNGASQNNIAGVQAGNGVIVITYAAGASIVQIAGLPSGSTFPVGTTTNTFEVTDASGNSAECSFDVTVTDDEDPIFVDCPDNAAITTTDGGETGDCAGQYEWDHPVPSDNCGIDTYVVYYENPDGTIDGPYDVYVGTTPALPNTSGNRNFDKGLTTVTYYLTDIHGNPRSTLPPAISPSTSPTTKTPPGSTAPKARPSPSAPTAIAPTA